MTTKQLEVTAGIKQADGSMKDFSGTGAVNLYAGVEDLMNALEDKESQGEIVNLINQSLEARERAKIRQQILAENAGPEKAIDRAIMQFMKAREAVGKPITEDKAREMVLSLGLV